jgi:hypothetical protein
LVTQANTDGQTPLHVACESNNWLFLGELLTFESKLSDELMESFLATVADTCPPGAVLDALEAVGFGV